MFANQTKPDQSTYNIVSSREPHGVVAEQYRKLRTNIEYSSFNKEIRTICLTSAKAAEGKTVTALNLATVYAQSGKKTLIIDMDLRRSKIHRAFDIPNKVGLSNLVIDEVDRSEAILVADENLHVLPAGKKMPYPAEFLMSDKIKALIESLKETYERIIIDTPPMTAVTDASIVSRLVDGTVVVIGSRRTETAAAEDIIQSLNENGANIIGGVLTRVSKKDHRYLDYYYEYK